MFFFTTRNFALYLLSLLHHIIRAVWRQLNFTLIDDFGWLVWWLMLVRRQTWQMSRNLKRGLVMQVVALEPAAMLKPQLSWDVPTEYISDGFKRVFLGWGWWVAWSTTKRLSQPKMAQTELGNVPGHGNNPCVLVLSNIDKVLNLVFFPWGYWKKEKPSIWCPCQWLGITINLRFGNEVGHVTRIITTYWTDSSCTIPSLKDNPNWNSLPCLIG